MGPYLMFNVDVIKKKKKKKFCDLRKISVSPIGAIYTESPDI